MTEIREITVKELLQETADSLDAIQVPVSMANEIARPIWQAVQSIRKCIDALNEQKPAEGEVTEDV